MKTLEVLDRVLKGKQLAEESRRQMTYVLEIFAEYSEEWPESGVIINEWLNSLDIADISKLTYFQILKSAGSYIHKYFKLDNPADTAEIPHFRKKQRRYFTPEECMLVLASCKYHYDRELILALMDSLCRIGGLSNLQGKDVLNGFIITHEKTGDRKYRLDVRICQALKKLAGSDDAWVFTKINGEKISANTLSQKVRCIVKRAGITGKKLGAHTFRHSGASLIAKEYRNVMIVQTLLQHDKPETSMQYIHDVDIEIQKDISPLQLMRDKAYNGNGFKEPESLQLTMGEESENENALMVVEEEVEPVNSFYGDMFPEIEDGIEIRPLLRTEDLNLLRLAFIELAQTEKNHNEMLKARELMKRMLRKAGSKGGNGG